MLLKHNGSHCRIQKRYAYRAIPRQLPGLKWHDSCWASKALVVSRTCVHRADPSMSWCSRSLPSMVELTRTNIPRADDAIGALQGIRVLHELIEPALAAGERDTKERSTTRNQSLTRTRLPAAANDHQMFSSDGSRPGCHVDVHVAAAESRV